jgi:hypothetical protein
VIDTVECARPFVPSDRGWLREAVACRLNRSFDVPVERARRCAAEIVDSVAELPDASVVAASASSGALLVPWIAADGSTETFVAAFGWTAREDRTRLLRRIWHAQGERRLRMRIALAPNEHEEVLALGLANRVTCVYVRTSQLAGEESPLVRAAVLDDHPYVQRLLEVAHERGFAHTEHVPDPAASARALASGMMAEVLGPDGICLVASEDGERLGHVSGVLARWDEYGEERMAELYDIFVTAAGRSGLGTVLERAFHATAARMGARVVEGNICPTGDPRFVDGVLSTLARKGWREHRRLLVVDFAIES